MCPILSYTPYSNWSSRCPWEGRNLTDSYAVVIKTGHAPPPKKKLSIGQSTINEFLFLIYIYIHSMSYWHTVCGGVIKYGYHKPLVFPLIASNDWMITWGTPTLETSETSRHCIWRFPKMLVPPNHPYLKYTIWMIDMDDSYMDYWYGWLIWMIKISIWMINIEYRIKYGWLKWIFNPINHPAIGDPPILRNPHILLKARESIRSSRVISMCCCETMEHHHFVL